MQRSEMTTAQMLDVAHRHGALEETGDLEPLLATLAPEPIFEFHPPGGQLIGAENLRDYYVDFIQEFMPLVEETFLLGEWADPRAVVVEYQIVLRVDGVREYHQLTASMYGAGDKLGGERLYGSPKLLDLMLGKSKQRLVPIQGVTSFRAD